MIGRSSLVSFFFQKKRELQYRDVEYSMYSLLRFSFRNVLQALVSLGVRGYILQLRESGADGSRLIA